MAKKTKKQLNVEFLEKIKTITVGTIPKSAMNAIGNLKCPGCGDPIKDHPGINVELVGIGMIPKHLLPPQFQRRKKKPAEDASHSFAA